jgi:hypothetical protein
MSKLADGAHWRSACTVAQPDVPVVVCCSFTCTPSMPTIFALRYSWTTACTTFDLSCATGLYRQKAELNFDHSYHTYRKGQPSATC